MVWPALFHRATIKTDQFTTKCKGDRVIGLKQSTVLTELLLEHLARPYQRS